MTKLVLCLFAALSVPAAIAAQQLDSPRLVADNAVAPLPEAPLPLQPAAPAQTPSAPAPLDGSSSSTAQNAPQPQGETPEQRKARAAAELNAEEHQRIGGLIPAFNGVLGGKATPLTSGQKFQLFFKNILDPYQFGIVAVDTGLQEAENTYPGYHYGVPGLLRNYGAAYADDFDGNFFGNAVLPSLLHQDPRYFRLGKGSYVHRLLYSASTTVRCKSDSGKWEPNYSNVFGNLIGGAISNAYYPAEDRGFGLTIDRGLTVTAEGALGALVIEFYPDVQHYIHRKHQEKLARQAAEQSAGRAQDVAPPATVPSAKP